MKRKLSLAPLVLATAVLAWPGAASAAPPPKSDYEKWAKEGTLQLLAHGPVSKESVAATAPTTERTTILTDSSSCWSASWGHDRGYLMYRRAIYQRTYWCGNYSYVTYRSTSEWADTGFLCNPMWGPASWRSGGGVGTWHVDVTTRGGFSCWVNYFQYNDWLEMGIRYTAWGSTYGLYAS